MNYYNDYGGANMANEFSILNKYTEVKGMDTNTVYNIFKISKNNVLKVLKKLILDELQSEYDQDVKEEITRSKKRGKILSTIHRYRITVVV